MPAARQPGHLPVRTAPEPPSPEGRGSRMIGGSWEDAPLYSRILAKNQETGMVQTNFQRRHLYQVCAKNPLSFKVIFYGQD